MNKKVKIQEINKLVHELDNSEKALKQSLAVITSRKEMLKQELEELGVSSNSALKGKIKDVLTDKQKVGLLGGLTL